jgi:hypothetical protein
MFGKRAADYIRFERWILLLIGLVFILRITLFFAGVQNSRTKWISINLALLAGMIYVSIAVHTTGFGSYGQLLASLFWQAALAHCLIVLAIIAGITSGRNNIFTDPEFFGGRDGKNWTHAILHLLLGPTLWPLVLWLPGSLLLFLTRKIAPRR